MIKIDYNNFPEDFNKFPQLEDLTAEQQEYIKNNGVSGFNEKFPNTVSDVGNNMKVSKVFLQAFHLNWLVDKMKYLYNFTHNLFLNKGEYSSYEEYKAGNYVEIDYNTYICMKDCSQIDLSNTTYWRKINGNGVKSTTITYQQGNSGTVVPTGTWSTNIPAVSSGKYLWTKAVLTYDNNKTSTLFSVGYNGAKGDKGDKGDNALSYNLIASNDAIYKYPSGEFAPSEFSLNTIKQNGTTTVDCSADIRIYYKTSVSADWILTTSYSEISGKSVQLSSLNLSSNVEKIKIEMLVSNKIVDTKIIPFINLSEFKGVVEDINYNGYPFNVIHCETANEIRFKVVTVPNVDFEYLAENDLDSDVFLVKFVQGGASRMGISLIANNYRPGAGFRLSDGGYITSLEKNSIYAIYYNAEHDWFQVLGRIDSIGGKTKYGLVRGDGYGIDIDNRGIIYHRIADGFYHIPKGGSPGQILGYAGNGCATWIENKSICYLVAVDNTVNSDGSCDCDSKYVKSADFVFNCKNGYSDTYSLNNFLNSLPVGSKVIFAPGSYLISNSIKINTRITLEGLNHRATFFIKNDVPILVIGGEGSDEANNVTIRNIYLMQYPFNDAQPPNHGSNIYYSFSSPIFKLTNSNGVYIEKCGIYAHSFRTPDNGYNSIVQCHGYATNCTIEKCVLNTTITSLKDSSSKPTGFILDVSDCPKQYSYKLIANFGTTTAYRGNTVAEISNVGCTGFKIYNNDRL